ncbi:hypothetical protein PSMK_13710 [Phycisphaera mikurensis NBRC 102666]|uniref:Uncharacterized protein n=2 Tax=Phycisphaera TaxID=666508 RepID=I0IE42_PHYMF|nr:hypothetical protein PSMK_13710 [Phycisphaera mikurensis NBRC 102666]
MHAARRPAATPALAGVALAACALAGGCAAPGSAGWTPDLIAPSWSLARDGARPADPLRPRQAAASRAQPPAADADAPVFAWASPRPPRLFEVLAP